MPAPFAGRLAAAFRRHDSLLCIGLDPEPHRLPAVLGTPDVEAVVAFNRAIVGATADLACAFKPNLAFYEALGPAGMEALLRTVAMVRELADGVLVIGDAKRGDVGNTARLYATALYDVYGFDAVTANPYLGADSLEPLLAREDRGVFVLCRTSNPGAAELQDAHLLGHQTVYERVAMLARGWNRYHNVGLVAGATYPEQLARIRALCPDLPLLAPGVGAQGGDLAATVRAGVDAAGGGLLVVAARQVLYASNGPDFASAARRAAAATWEAINRSRRCGVGGV